MSSSTVLCAECGTSCQRKLWTFWDKGEYSCDGDGCNAKLCSTCINTHPLLTGSNNLAEATIHKYCTPCFQQTSVLDFSQTYDVIDGNNNSGITFVFVHGGCGSRAMFHDHAVELNKRHGHRSVLLDLPGHGSLVDTPLTLESCKETLGAILKQTTDMIQKNSSNKTIFVGGSLGAYIGFYLIDEFKEFFSGAILMDCGQNVGPGASLKAKMGLLLLATLGDMCSNATLLKMMVDTSKKSQADYHLVETCYGAGMFFDQVKAQVECLKAIAPAEYIPRVDFPILFMNGSEDYRDSEELWLSLCKDQRRSELKVYEGGDHFFTHDGRFVEDILERMDAFAKNKTASSSKM